MMRRFHLVTRDPADPAGVAAELIGQGVQYGEGTTVIYWTHLSFEITRQTPEQAAAVEQVELIWLDPAPVPAARQRLRVAPEGATP